jgi:hypothetical protein
MNLRAVYDIGFSQDNVVVSWNHLTLDHSRRAYVLERRRKTVSGFEPWQQIYGGSDNVYYDFDVVDFTNYQYRAQAFYYNFWEYKSDIVEIKTEQCPVVTNWCFKFSKDANANTILYWHSPDPKGDEYDVYYIYHELNQQLTLLGTATGRDRSFNIGTLDYRDIHIDAITRNMCEFTSSCYWPPEPPPPPPEPCNHFCPTPPLNWCYQIDEATQALVWEQPVAGGTYTQLEANGECVEHIRTFTYIVRHLDIPSDKFSYTTTGFVFEYSTLLPADFNLNVIDPERFYIICQTNDGCSYQTVCEFQPEPPCDNLMGGCYDCDCCGYTEDYWTKTLGKTKCTITIPNPPTNAVFYDIYKNGVWIARSNEPKYEIP